MTRLRDDHVKRFRGSRRRLPTEDGSVFDNHAAALLMSPSGSLLHAEPEPEGARAICLHCRDGGAAEQLMLCDGAGCDHVSWAILPSGTFETEARVFGVRKINLKPPAEMFVIWFSIVIGQCASRGQPLPLTQRTQATSVVPIVMWYC